MGGVFSSLWSYWWPSNQDYKIIMVCVGMQANVQYLTDMRFPRTCRDTVYCITLRQ